MLMQAILSLSAPMGKLDESPQKRGGNMLMQASLSLFEPMGWLGGSPAKTEEDWPGCLPPSISL